MNQNLACAIHRHSLATPDAPAAACQGQTLSYGELAARAARLAGCLATSPAWGRRDGQPPRVGLLASRSVEACVALIGACWAGATYVPINLKLPEERILDVMARCGLAALVTDDAGARRLGPRLLAACPPLVVHAGTGPLPPALAENDPIVSLVRLDALPPTEPDPPAAMAGSDTAYIIFTSGTTGAPKGVMISAGAARHYMAMIATHLDLQASDRALETCELSFDFSVHNMFATWEAGASLHILPAPQVMNAVKFARNAGLTVWNSVPSLAGLLRQIKTLAPESLPGLRITVFGGEQLPVGTVAAWRRAAPGSAIFNLYGPTEATVFCLAQPLSSSPTEEMPVTANRDCIAIGTPLPGTEAAILDEAGHPLPAGSPGELALAGVQLAQGYLGAPALTAARFPELDGKRWYRTGDLALRDGAGRFHCLGRIDNQIKVMGYRVELEEIDAHLRAVSGADVVGCVGWPMTDGVARGIVGFVGGDTIDAGQIIAGLKERLPPYMVPGRVLALARMPVNASGKVDRQALGRWLAEEAQ